MAVKTCTKCGLGKEASEYYRNSGQAGLMSWCKACHCAMTKANRERPGVKARMAARYRERRAAGYRCRSWAEKSPEERKAASASVQRWRAKNRETERSHARQYRKLRRSAVFKELWPRVVEAYGGRCLGCGAEATCADHVIPLSVRGDNVLENLQPLCRACNASKAGKRTDYRWDGGALIRRMGEEHYANSVPGSIARRKRLATKIPEPVAI